MGLLAAGASFASAAGRGLLGELSLTARCGRAGVLPMAMAAREAGIRTLFVPAENAAEATLTGGLTVYGVPDVNALVAHLTGETPLSPAPPWAPVEETAADLPDLRDVMGQENVKRALEVAAAGGHNLLLIGSPGAGKSMLAKRLPSILPDMSRGEALEVSGIWSVAGLADPGHPLLTRRPFRSPHHTASLRPWRAGPLCGPGKISLAHTAFLFLDELPEFRRDVLRPCASPGGGGHHRGPGRGTLLCPPGFSWCPHESLPLRLAGASFPAGHLLRPKVRSTWRKIPVPCWIASTST